MNNDIFSEEIYKEINNLKVPKLIANKLKEYSAEFNTAYKKYGNMLRNKKFREHNKDNINNKRKEQRAKIRRESIKPIEHIVEPLNIAKVELTATRGYKKDRALNVCKLKDSTISNYKSVIKTLYSKYNKTQIEDTNDIIKMLEGKKYSANVIYKDFKFIISDIENIAINNTGYLSNIYSIFSLFKQKRLIKIRDVVYPYFKAHGEQYRENRHNNIINNEEIEKISFNPEDINDNINKIEGAYNRLLYALMFKLPTRRLADYRNMKISKEIPINLDKEYNYYYDGKIYIYNTKNKKNMIQDISGEDIILKLIKELPEDTIYIISGKERCSQPKLTKIFSKITKGIYGTTFNSRDIRKISATLSFNNITCVEDIGKFKKEAKNRGHSTNEALEYVLKGKTE